jgi:membrane protein implicated in regulation of membrane protease activity
MVACPSKSMVNFAHTLIFTINGHEKKLVALALLGFAALVFLVLLISYPLIGIVFILLVLGFLALCVRWYNNRKKPTAPVTP